MLGSDFDWNALRSSTSAQLMVRFGEERGIPRAKLLANSAINSEILADPTAEIASWQELEVARNLQCQLPDDAQAGLDLGLRYQITTHGTWGFALLGCETARDALEVALRYVALSCTLVRPLFEQDGQDAYLVVDDSHLPEATRRFLVHRDAAAIATVRRDVLPMVPLLKRMCFRHRPAHDLGSYERIWGLTPEFAAERNMAVFDAALLDLPLPRASEHARSLGETQCRELLARRTVPRSFAERVRAYLRTQPGQLPTMDRAALHFGMTARTLRRRLAAENMTYRQLIDAWRLVLARELLQQQELTLADIAERLDYSTPSAFLQAFKRMTGSTPGHYRIDVSNLTGSVPAVRGRDRPSP